MDKLRVTTSHVTEVQKTKRKKNQEATSLKIHSSEYGLGICSLSLTTDLSPPSESFVSEKADTNSFNTPSSNIEDEHPSQTKTADSGANFGEHLDRKNCHVDLVKASENKNVPNKVPKILGTPIKQSKGTAEPVINKDPHTSKHIPTVLMLVEIACHECHTKLNGNQNVSGVTKERLLNTVMEGNLKDVKDTAEMIGRAPEAKYENIKLAVNNSLQVSIPWLESHGLYKTPQNRNDVHPVTGNDSHLALFNSRDNTNREALEQPTQKTQTGSLVFRQVTEKRNRRKGKSLFYKAELLQEHEEFVVSALKELAKIQSPNSGKVVLLGSNTAPLTDQVFSLQRKLKTWSVTVFSDSQLRPLVQVDVPVPTNWYVNSTPGGCFSHVKEEILAARIPQSKTPLIHRHHLHHNLLQSPNTQRGYGENSGTITPKSNQKVHRSTHDKKKKLESSDKSRYCHGQFLIDEQESWSLPDCAFPAEVHQHKRRQIMQDSTDPIDLLRESEPVQGAVSNASDENRQVERELEPMQGAVSNASDKKHDRNETDTQETDNDFETLEKDGNFEQQEIATFVPPRRPTYSQKSIDNLEVEAAEFLTEKFATSSSNMGQATKVTKTREGEKTKETKCRLPNLFGQKVVVDEFLPTGWKLPTGCETNAPNPNRYENEDSAEDHNVPGNLEGYTGDTAEANIDKE
eukprot:gene9965-18581_t